MFTFNLVNLLEVIVPKKAKQRHFEPLFDTRYEPPSPGEIRKSLEKLSHCSHCHFLIFDNYWSNEIDNKNTRLCPTCGNKI